MTACPDPCTGKPFATQLLLTCQAYRGIRLLKLLTLGLCSCARDATCTTLLLQETQSPVACKALPLTLGGLT